MKDLSLQPPIRVRIRISKGYVSGAAQPSAVGGIILNYAFFLMVSPCSVCHGMSSTSYIMPVMACVVPLGDSLYSLPHAMAYSLLHAMAYSLLLPLGDSF